MISTPRRLCVATLGWAALVMGCGAPNPAVEDTSPAVTAESEVVTAQPFDLTLDVIGEVAPRLGRTATLTAPTSTRILRVLVVPGQRVRAGDPLVELDRSTIDAMVQSAEAAAVAADAEAARADRLVTAGILPRRDAERATADAARARSELTTARRAAQWSAMIAPIAGVITRVAATPGATAEPGMVLVELTDASTTDLVFTVTPTEAARLLRGQRLQLTGTEGPDSLGEAAITEIGGVVDSLSRGVLVRAAISGSSRLLRIGESVLGHVQLGRVARAVVVPVSALVPAGELFRVFVLDSANIAHGREVTVGGQNRTHAYLTAGLAVGERVVTTGAYGLDDGVTVKSAAGTAP